MYQKAGLMMVVAQSEADTEEKIRRWCLYRLAHCWGSHCYAQEILEVASLEGERNEEE